MLSHQIPLIDIASLTLEIKTNNAEKKSVNKEKKGFMGFINNYKKLQTSEESQKSEKSQGNEYKLKIISFIEPNDLLSYAMTYDIDGIKINNIQIGNSKKWFGLFVKPLDANHGIDYLESPDVVNFIINGLEKKCSN